jgi:hypothetical protein
MPLIACVMDGLPVRLRKVAVTDTPLPGSLLTDTEPTAPFTIRLLTGTV